MSAAEACCNDTKFEPDDNKACCNDEGIYDPSIREGNFSVGAQGTDYFKAKLSQALSNIPGCGNVEITAAGVSFTKTLSDCCPDSGAPVVDGSKGAVGNGTLSANVEDITVWPQGGITTQEFEKTIWGNTFEVMVNIGVLLDLEISTGVGLGYLDNSCQNKLCYYGNIALQTTFTLSAQLEAILCTKFIGQDEEECGEVTVTPAAITCAAGVSGSYNENGDCHKGWDGASAVGPISVDTTVRIGVGEFSWNWWEWEGWSS